MSDFLASQIVPAGHSTSGFVKYSFSFLFHSALPPFTNRVLIIQNATVRIIIHFRHIL